MLLRLWLPRRKTKCRVTEEWCGSFIGRRYCSTHGLRWDDGGLCPAMTPPEHRCAACGAVTRERMGD